MSFAGVRVFLNRSFFYLALLLGLSACGGLASSLNGGGGSNTSKKLFSAWTSASTGMLVNWSNGAFNSTRPVQYIYDSGARCQCSVLIAGSESAGSFVLSSCAYTSGGTGDPGCTLMDGAGNYIKSSGLTICSGSNCDTFH